jgi:O-antigen/teichoic acid export membrane protein
VRAAVRALLDAAARARRDHDSTIFYAASSVAKAALGFVATMVTMKTVAPGHLGLWNSMSLATTYSAFLQAGVNNGLNRELPFHLGAGDERQARRLAGTALSFTAASCVLALAGGLAALLIFRDQGTAFAAAIAVETIAVLCFFYQSYLTVTFRSTTSFKALAKVEFAGVAIGLAALPLVYYFSYYGMLWRIAVISVIGIAMLHLVRPIHVGLEWDGESLRRLLKTGLPIFALFYVESTFSTFDRLFLLETAGLEQVGFYSLAMMAQQAMMVVPLSIAMYMYPRMTYHWGHDGSRRALWGRAWKTSAAAAAIMLPVAVAGYLALPWFVSSFVPRYVPGITAAQIMLVGALFSGSAIGVNALWSMKAWKYMTAYQLGGAGLRALGPYVGLQLYSDALVAVALGTAAACALQFVLGMVLTFHATIAGPGAGADRLPA